jgi:hypothetical protein
MQHMPPDNTDPANENRIPTSDVFLGSFFHLDGMFSFRFKVGLSDVLLNSWCYLRAGDVSGFERLFGIYQHMSSQPQMGFARSDLYREAGDECILSCRNPSHPVAIPPSSNKAPSPSGGCSSVPWLQELVYAKKGFQGIEKISLVFRLQSEY